MKNVKGFKSGFTAFFFLFILSISYAQNPQWVNYSTTNSGLTNNDVRTIICDRQGKMWVGTFGGGLCRFDGLSWSYFNSGNSQLADNNVLSLAADLQNNIWVGTNHTGVFKYNNNGWVRFDTSIDYISTHSISDISLDHQGNVWVIGQPWTHVNEWEFAARYDGANWVSYHYQQGAPSSFYPLCVDFDLYNNKWFGDLYYSLWEYNDPTWINYNPASCDSGARMNSIAFDSQNMLWLCTSNGVRLFNGTDCIYSAWPGYSFSSVYIDYLNIKWFASSAGLMRYDGSGWVVYDTTNCGILSNQVNSIAIDDQGNLWCGTDKGISVLNHACSMIPPSRISGKVYLDRNQNGYKDPVEPYIPNQKVLLLPDSIYSYSNINGEYVYYADSGNYSVQYIPFGFWSLSSANNSYSFTVDTADFIVPDFGAKADDTTIINIMLSCGISRCNTAVPYWLNYKNEGTTVESGFIGFKPDPITTLLQAYPLYDSASNGSYFWHFNNLFYGEEHQIRIELQTPGIAFIGDTLVSTSIIHTANILSTDTLRQIFVCSYDPNDKAVYPFGKGPEKYTLMSETLRYTIRFQNTGNDTAFNITIRDTLSPYLDVNSFKLLASSHPVNTNLKTSGALLFRFDNIMLPDSGRNQDLSQGYITYSIKPKAGLANNSEVRNTSYIFFDFNPAVQTNTTLNTMVYNLPVGINDKNPFTGSKLTIYPNPTNGQIRIVNPYGSKPLFLSIFNSQGQEVYRSEKPEKELDVKLPAAGLYLVKGYNNENEWSNKVIVVY